MIAASLMEAVESEYGPNCDAQLVEVHAVTIDRRKYEVFVFRIQPNAKLCYACAVGKPGRRSTTHQLVALKTYLIDTPDAFLRAWKSFGIPL